MALGGMVPPMFWSPDSRFIAFDATGQLKKVDVTGGASQTVCTLPALAIGGSWNQDDVIVVGSPAGGLVRCAASGGPSSIVTHLDSSQQQSAHIFPWFLPDGRRFLYLSVSRNAPEQSGIYIRSLDTPAQATSTRVLTTGFAAAYVADGSRDSGHLLFMRDGALLAQTFDPARVALTGSATRIAGPVGAFLDNAFFSASKTGTLAFKGSDDPVWLTWLDRRGNVLHRVGDPGMYSGLALARDATRAVVVKDVVRATVDQDLWLVDLDSGRSRKLTSAARLESWPIWSADDKHIFFAEAGAIGSIFEQPINGDQEPRLLLQSQQHKIPTSSSHDGSFLLFTSETIGSTRADVWVMPLTADPRVPHPLIRRPQDQQDGQVSPDGRAVAYVSNESGRVEVMVRAFEPAPVNAVAIDAESVTVSRFGGTAPRWSADGKELFFITRDGAIASTAVSTYPAIRVAEPVVLFRAPGIATHWGVAGSGVDVRFLVLAPEVATASTSFSLVLDWQGILERPKSPD
jgi:Tol biopolymer transport system component